MISKETITPFQLFFILIHAQIGVGIISMPHEVFLKADSDSWISVILAGIIIQITILMFGVLMLRFPTTNLFGIIDLLFGKWLGKMLIIAYSIYFLILGGIFLARFALILKTWMMPLTPQWTLMALMIIFAIYTVKEGIQVIARFFVLASLVLFVFIGFAIYSLKDGTFMNILPIGQSGALSVIKGVESTLHSFQGFESLLLIYPFVRSNKKDLVKTATLANLFVTLFYLFFVFVSLLVFSPREFSRVPEPILYLVKSFSFTIVERPDLIFTSIWIVLVATTLITILYVSFLGLSEITNSKHKKVLIYIAAGIIFFLALNFYGEYRNQFVAKFFNPFILLFAFGLPLLCTVITIVFNKKKEESNE